MMLFLNYWKLSTGILFHLITAVSWSTDLKSKIYYYENAYSKITRQMDFQDYYCLYDFLFNRSEFGMVCFGLYRNYVPDSVFSKYAIDTFRLCVDSLCFSGFILWIINSLNTNI